MLDVIVAQDDENTTKPAKLLGVRHFQCVLMFLTLVISFGMRTILSVTIISMTEKTSPDPSIPTYPEWDNADTILSSFFWGYVMLQIGAGQLCEYFGSKWFLVITLIIGSIFNIIVPTMAASMGSTGVIICRVVQGLTQGVLFPAAHNIISKWTPLFERSTMSSFVYGGGSIGIAISMPIIGAIAGSNLGWPSAFYIYGGVGIIWSVIYAILAEDSPSTHKSISKEEKMYIESSNSITQTQVKKVPTPWWSIFTSMPMWAIMISASAQCWGYFTLLTEIPSYMSHTMNFDINSNGQLSSLPYVARFVLAIATAPISDALISRKILSITTNRKIFNSLGSFVPAAALIYLAFIDNSQTTLVIVLLILAVGSNAFAQSGYLVNVIDLAPNHAGTVIGIVNCGCNIFSIFGPLTVGLLGSDKQDLILWREVFLLAAGIYIGCGLFYIFFASGEVQFWNDVEEKEEKKKTEEVSRC